LFPFGCLFRRVLDFGHHLGVLGLHSGEGAGVVRKDPVVQNPQPDLAHPSAVGIVGIPGMGL